MDADPIAQAEAVLQQAQKTINLEVQDNETRIQMLEGMTGLSHELAHRAYAIYTMELAKLAEKNGITIEALQHSLGEAHCLILLGMVAGGLHAQTDIRFGTEGEGS